MNAVTDTAIDSPEVRTRALRRRNDRLLVGGILAYSALVAAVMIGAGVSITPDFLAVAFGLAAVLLGRGRLFLRDWAPFIVLLLAYELMRGIADDVGFPLHAADLVTAERILFLGVLPTQVLQDALHPETGADAIAMVATVIYMLHFVLPLATGFVLWAWRRPAYYDFVAGLVLLSVAGFISYLLLPAAPPWYVANDGLLDGPDGRPVIAYLKPDAFETLAAAIGFDGRRLYSLAFDHVNPNLVAAFPSLHVGYPFLTFLFLRRAFGRPGWLALGYAGMVTFSVVYTGDHWVIDAIAGAAYAYVAFYAVAHLPQRWSLAPIRRPWQRREPPGRRDAGDAVV